MALRDIVQRLIICYNQKTAGDLCGHTMLDIIKKRQAICGGQDVRNETWMVQTCEEEMHRYTDGEV